MTVTFETFSLFENVWNYENHFPGFSLNKTDIFY